MDGKRARLTSSLLREVGDVLAVRPGVVFGVEGELSSWLATGGWK